MKITNEEAIKMLKEFAIVDAIQEDYDVIDMAIKALEKQIPVKPNSKGKIGKSNMEKAMKVDELIQQLTPYKDFELQANLVEIDNKNEGWGGLNYRWFNVTGVDDIGHSSKIIVLGIEDIVFETGCTKEDYGNTWVPKLYAPYYYPDFEQPESVWRSQWTDTWTDNRIKNTVGIYKTKQQALDKAIKLGWLEEELKCMKGG